MSLVCRKTRPFYQLYVKPARWRECRCNEKGVDAPPLDSMYQSVIPAGKSGKPAGQHHPVKGLTLFRRLDLQKIVDPLYTPDRTDNLLGLLFVCRCVYSAGEGDGSFEGFHRNGETA